MLRTEPRSTGSRPWRASTPIAESAKGCQRRSTRPLNRRRIKTSTAAGDRSGSITFRGLLDVGVERRARDPLLTPPSSPNVLERTSVDVSFLAGMLIDKFRYHLPLHRQHQRLADSASG